MSDDLISIIGSGKVGSAIAFLVASNGLSNIVLVNRTKSKAVGESLDLANAIPANSPISITGTDDFSKIKNSKIVVIAASTAIYQTGRTENLVEQTQMIKSIAIKVKEYAPNSLVLVVSNPLDILTYIFLKMSGFPKNKVIGIASSLDTSRFRFLLANLLGVRQSNIKDALVLGEHGDSMFPIFSVTKKDETPITELLDKDQIEQLTQEVRDYWKAIRNFKSRSVFGISKNTFDVIEAIMKNKTLKIPASVLLAGEFGINDICVGVPIELNENGLIKINEIPLTKIELESLRKSAEVVKSYVLTCVR